MRQRWVAAIAAFLALAATTSARADPAPADVPAAAQPPQAWATYVQSTFVEQGYPGFRSPYAGPQSLPPASSARETWDVTFYAGVRPWAGAEIWINPEVDQGFGLDNTLGVAGFPSAEAYKVGGVRPYLKLPRLFLRQTIDLGGSSSSADAEINQLGGSQSANRIVLTAGKFSVVDVFDTNSYAHDPRGDFLNWAIVDAGTFDYAANAWGFTYGAAGELYYGPFAARTGAFDLSYVPNSVALDTSFRQFQLIGELEGDYQIAGRPGAVKLTGFVTRGRMAYFADAIRYGEETDGPPLLAPVRRFRSRPGVSLDLQQQASPDVGVFLRAGWADGRLEPYEFADIDETVSAGVSLKGQSWGRPDDVVGLSGDFNQISKVHQEFLNDGGLGILVGDGKLPYPGLEEILEAYYNVAARHWLHVTFDYQFVDNPGYNRDRGPVSIGAVRFHLQF
jgi:high affinity Mn2+ porin